MSATWDEDGQLMSEAWYKNGKLDGKFFQRLPDGREVVFHYVKNQRHGLHQIYYPPEDGFEKQKALEGNYVYGKAARRGFRV